MTPFTTVSVTSTDGPDNIVLTLADDIIVSLYDVTQRTILNSALHKTDRATNVGVLDNRNLLIIIYFEDDSKIQ